jgi:hypothetical protein
MILRSFESREPMFLISFFNMCVRPILEYCSPVWSPHLLCDIATIERVQRKFTKRIPSLKHLSYPDRLLALNTISLRQRRLYLDLVFMYKIVYGMSTVTLDAIGLSALTCRPGLRHSGFTLNSYRPLSNLSLYYFGYRTCKLWNCLPSKVKCLSLASFKLHISKLDLINMFVQGH